MRGTLKLFGLAGRLIGAGATIRHAGFDGIFYASKPAE